MDTDIRHDWTPEEVQAIYDRPLLELVHDAQRVHRRHHDPRAIQRCTLLSIKTGGCPEDCGYCPQSARHQAGVESEALLSVDQVLETARRAKDGGASRFCMGAAWRSAKRGEQFDRVLEMVRGIRDLGMEACATLGMLDADQARALREAGLTSYNHNLDTSADHYDSIISTRRYDDRLRTLEHVREAGIRTCCGGIVGMGETPRDRCEMLRTLAAFDPHPESVPVNQLVRVPGTPLEDAPPPDVFDVVRTIATARILMPASRVRLAAGRRGLTREGQAMCFLAGANSIFFGDQLLTTPNPDEDDDVTLLRDLGLATA
ncbi:MAG: biotin synthase BioB [Myxococcota bacterium]